MIFNKIKKIVNPYNQKDSSLRQGIMVKGEWNPKITEYVKKKNIRAIYLNCSTGWTGKNYSFLTTLSNIEELDIISGRCEELEAIQTLTNLREVNITCTTKSTLDFTRLTKLKKCSLSWWDGANSIFKCKLLTSLFLDNWKTKNHSEINNLHELKTLSIFNSNFNNLKYLSNLVKLEKLELVNCKELDNIDDLKKLKNLKWLAIDGSKNIKDINVLSTLNNLNILDITDIGSIENIAPIEKLKDLQAFSFAGCTNVIDGDLSVLTSLPRLSMLMFTPRKHYTHKLIKKWNWDNFNRPEKLLDRIKKGQIETNHQ